MKSEKPASGRLFCSSIGNFSEFSYRRTTLRGMRTTRIRKMVAIATALRRACASRRTLFLYVTARPQTVNMITDRSFIIIFVLKRGICSSEK